MYTNTIIVNESYEQRFLHLYLISKFSKSKELRRYINDNIDELMKGYERTDKAVEWWYKI